MNTEKSRRIELIVWGALVLTILGITAAFLYGRLRPKTVTLPVISTVGDFTLTNQHGKIVSLGDLRGKPWMANIIFTHCAGPCPIMTKAMRGLQDATEPGLRLITLTTDPANDTPEVLRRYGEKFGADFSRWSFLTGSKEQIRKLAVDGLKLVAQEKPPAERESPDDLFIHATAFVMVDKTGKVRSAFQLDDPDLKSKVGDAARALQRE